MSCGSRRLWGPLGWALLLVVLASCLTSLLAADVDKVGCEKHTNCSSCVNNSESEMKCNWLQCNDVTLSHCTNKTEEHINCSAISSTNGTCQAFPTNGTTARTPTTASTIATTAGNTTNTTSPAVRPTNSTVTTATVATATNSTVPGSVSPKPTSKPSPHKSTFDAASFIGGIVLVLGLQAVIFFLYKFCKSKEQNYHTL